VVGVFEALGEPVRRRILEHLAAGEQPAGAVVAAVQAGAAISQPAVSQHLKVLREPGAIDPDGVRAAQAWLAGLGDPLAAFAQPLVALATEVARGRKARTAARRARRSA
jgi:hypothetical protein